MGAPYAWLYNKKVWNLVFKYRLPKTDRATKTWILLKPGQKSDPLHLIWWAVCSEEELQIKNSVSSTIQVTQKYLYYLAMALNIYIIIINDLLIKKKKLFKEFLLINCSKKDCTFFWKLTKLRKNNCDIFLQYIYLEHSEIRTLLQVLVQLPHPYQTYQMNHNLFFYHHHPEPKNVKINGLEIITVVHVNTVKITYVSVKAYDSIFANF